LNPATPDRPRDQHHTWSVGGKKYTLVFGDLHRHTDFSNCRCGQDGCVLEHFRYAYDMAELDFMGTSDHTDANKKYDPYEMVADAAVGGRVLCAGEIHFALRLTSESNHIPGVTVTWSSRNVADRLSISTENSTKASQWNALYPVARGAAQISPMELWDVLGKYGKPVALISHTGATAMGTDWDKYERD